MIKLVSDLKESVDKRCFSLIVCYAGEQVSKTVLRIKLSMRKYLLILVSFSCLLSHCASQSLLKQTQTISPFHTKGIGSFLFRTQLSQVVKNPDCHDYNQSPTNPSIQTCQRFTKLDGKTPYSLRFTFSQSKLSEIEVILHQSASLEPSEKDLQFLLNQIETHIVNTFLQKRSFRKDWQLDGKDRPFKIRFPWGSDIGQPVSQVLNTFQQEHVPRMEIVLQTLEKEDDKNQEHQKQVGAFIQYTSEKTLEIGLFYRDFIPSTKPQGTKEYRSPPYPKGWQSFRFGMNQSQALEFCPNPISGLSKDFTKGGYYQIGSFRLPETNESSAPEIQCKDYNWLPGFTSNIFLTFSTKCFLCDKPLSANPTLTLHHIRIETPLPAEPAEARALLQQILLQKDYGEPMYVDQYPYHLPTYCFPELNPSKIRELLKYIPTFALFLDSGVYIKVDKHFVTFDLEATSSLYQELQSQFPDGNNLTEKPGLGEKNKHGE